MPSTEIDGPYLPGPAVTSRHEAGAKMQATLAADSRSGLTMSHASDGGLLALLLADRLLRRDPTHGCAALLLGWERCQPQT